MDYIKKTIIISLISSFIFSLFLLATLQVNRKFNENSLEENVLGVNTEKTTLCRFIDSLAIKYCGESVIVSSTLPVTNSVGITSIGVTTNANIKNNYSSVDPRNVTAVPSDDGKSVTITWNSESASVGKIEYGATAASMVLMAAEASAATSHNVSLSTLRPATTYYYRIRVGDDVFDNGGIPYSFKTKNSNASSTSIKNINVDTDSGTAKITWVSSTSYSAIIEYGTTAASLVLMSPETSATNNHSISLTSLRPSTTYYFRIKVAGQTMDNGGIPYTFKTKN